MPHIVPRMRGSLLLAALFTLTLAGCEKKEPTAGEKIENAMESAGEKIGDAVDKTAEKAGNAIENAGDKIEDATDKAAQ